jgi:hypothetical protein
MRGHQRERGGVVADVKGAGDVPAVEDVPVRRLRWTACARVVPTRFPATDLFERVADPADYDAVIAVESLTNDRLRDERGEAPRVADRDRAMGPGASVIMAPFTHISPIGGRFTDGTYGAYYAARTRETAVHETVYHRERFMAATSEPPMNLEMRVLEADLDGPVHDIRTIDSESLYDPESYARSQEFARSVRLKGSNGMVYRSVRHEGGQCVAVFRPRLLRRGRQAEYLLYRWDGRRIAEVLQLTHRMT